jgi:hypothetical protein
VRKRGTTSSTVEIRNAHAECSEVRHRELKGEAAGSRAAERDDDAAADRQLGVAALPEEHRSRRGRQRETPARGLTCLRDRRARADQQRIGSETKHARLTKRRARRWRRGLGELQHRRLPGRRRQVRRRQPNHAQRTGKAEPRDECRQRGKRRRDIGGALIEEEIHTVAVGPGPIERDLSGEARIRRRQIGDRARSTEPEDPERSVLGENRCGSHRA